MTTDGENPLSVLRDLLLLVLPQGPISTARLVDDAETTTSTAAGGVGVVRSGYAGAPPLFALQAPVDAASAFFCRAVLVDREWAAFLDGRYHRHHGGGGSNYDDDEDAVLGRSSSSSFGQRIERLFRLTSATLLGVLAYHRATYTTICAVHLYTHVVPRTTTALLRWTRKSMATTTSATHNGTSMNGTITTKSEKKIKPTTTATMSVVDTVSLLLVLLLAAPACLYLCRLFSNPAFLFASCKLVPKFVVDVIEYMFPVQELIASHKIISAFVDVENGGERLRRMLKHLLFVTFHAQVGLGYIGIDFLKAEQTRRNMLIRMDLEKPPPDDDADGVDGDATSSDDPPKKKAAASKATTTKPKKKIRCLP